MHNFLKNISKNSKGVSLIIVIIIVTAVVLIISSRLALTGVDETISSNYQTKSLEVYAAADGCLDEAFAKLSGNPAYTGEAMLIGQISCTIQVTGSGETRTIRVMAVKDGLLTSTVEADIVLNGIPSITAWREMSN